jgi:hypothetical protein
MKKNFKGKDKLFGDVTIRQDGRVIQTLSENARRALFARRELWRVDH